jgi:LemA protein
MPAVLVAAGFILCALIGITGPGNSHRPKERPLMTYMVLAIVALIAAYAIYAFNKLTRLKFLVSEGWSGIDVQLKRRAELIPNLVEVVKAYAEHERSLFENLTRLRQEAITGGSVGAQAASGQAMATQLSRLFALAEAYPELKADANFRKLQEQLADIEDQLQMARRYYNGTVRNLNTMIQQAPSNIIAGRFGFREAEFFEIDDHSQREVPQVTLER